jgi:hypothetical protein
VGLPVSNLSRWADNKKRSDLPPPTNDAFFSHCDRVSVRPCLDRKLENRIDGCVLIGTIAITQLISVVAMGYVRPCGYGSKLAYTVAHIARTE